MYMLVSEQPTKENVVLMKPPNAVRPTLPWKFFTNLNLYFYHHLVLYQMTY